MWEEGNREGKKRRMRRKGKIRTGKKWWEGGKVEERKGKRMRERVEGKEGNKGDGGK